METVKREGVRFGAARERLYPGMTRRRAEFHLPAEVPLASEGPTSGVTGGRASVARPPVTALEVAHPLSVTARYSTKSVAVDGTVRR